MATPDDDSHPPAPAESRRHPSALDEARQRAEGEREKARASARRGVGHHVKWILINIAWIVVVAWMYGYFLVPRLTAYLDH